MNGNYGRYGTTKDGAASTAATGGAGTSTSGNGWNTLLNLALEYGDDVVDIVRTGQGGGGSSGASYPTTSQGSSAPASSGSGGGPFWKPGGVVKDLQEQKSGGSTVAKMGTAGWMPWVIGGVVVLGAGYFLSRR
jgi:hypothetical protein